MGTVSLDLYVSDINDVLRSYNVFKIRRSVTGETGPYVEMTGPDTTHAALQSLQKSTFNVAGKTLKLMVDHTEPIPVVFLGLAPLTPAQAVAQINILFPGLASENMGIITLQSSLLGSVSVVQVVEGSAAIEFGWAEGQKAIGLEKYVYLVPGQTDYTFIDRDGETTYFYEAAFYNTSTHLTSAWSEPFKGGTGTVISASNLSLAHVDIVDAAGVAVSEQRITFYSQHIPLKVEGFQAAMIRRPVTIETNNDGHAEVSLIRGLRLKVVFEGTSFIREITVPDQADFDILDLMAAAPDPFNSIEPYVPFAIRRTP
jgi:hypothetical protein